MIINTKYPCDNQSLLYYFKRLQKKYPFFHYQSIGKSVLGNDIYCGRLGYGRKNIFIGAAFHSLEWITTLILLKFIEDYCNAKVSNKTILGHSVKDAFAYCSIYLVPLVNPDGVDLVLHKPTSKHPCYQQIIQMVDEKELAHV